MKGYFRMRADELPRHTQYTEVGDYVDAGVRRDILYIETLNNSLP
jgi:hypothetical protein